MAENIQDSQRKTVVLAFSGGLDTSFCVPYLRERGFDVATAFVDTGGVSADERAWIENRARELGACKHVTYDAGADLWEQVVVPIVRGGSLYQDQYPVLCSDRYVIVERALALAREIGTRYIAHGSTAMGNDQVRFDVAASALADVEIVAPIRDLQSQHGDQPIRVYEANYLRERGFEVRDRVTRYTINENLLGVTVSGSEIDAFGEPGPETYVLTARPTDWPREPLRIRIGIERGRPVSLDGESLPGPELLARLNRALGAYGVGRGIYTGDTVIGLKGRIVFEAPGIHALFVAHRALEEAVLSQEQNQFKPLLARKWIDLTYRGLFFEPLKHDIEAFLEGSQGLVTGTVTLMTAGGTCYAAGIESENLLVRKGATYAQSADWSAADAEGFIKLFGQSTICAAHMQRNRAPKP